MHCNVYVEVIVLTVMRINYSHMVSLLYHFFCLFNLCDNCYTLISDASSFSLALQMFRPSYLQKEDRLSLPFTLT